MWMWLPFRIPNSVRLLDPTSPQGASENFTGVPPFPGQVVPAGLTNVMTDFGWEYVWHCHLLGHEENDMMRAIKFAVPSTVPTAPALSFTRPGNVILTWTDGTPGGLPLGSPAGEVGFRVERAVVTGGVPGAYAQIAAPLANVTTYTDTLATPALTYAYRVTAWNAAGPSTSNVVTVAPLASFTLSGSVTAAGIGVVGALVHVVTAAGVYITNTPTGALGAYSFTLSPGTYKLYIQPNKAGYADQWFGGTSVGTATVITVAGNTVQNIPLN